MRTGSYTPKMTGAAAALAAALLYAGAPAAQAATTPAATTTMPAAGHDARESARDATMHIDKTAKVLRQMQADPGMAALLKKASGVFVVPDYARAGLGVGARGGAGVLLVRHGDTWQDPAFYNMGGVSVGFQAGVEAGAVALVLNNQKAVDSFRQENKFSLNAGAGLTIVNWSRKAQGSAGQGDITAWSDTEGLFGGATISITDVNFDENETSAYYNRRVTSRDVLGGKIRDPHAMTLRKALAGTMHAGAASSMGKNGMDGSTASGSGATMPPAR